MFLFDDVIISRSQCNVADVTNCLHTGVWLNSVCCKITCMIFHTLCNYHRGSRAKHVLSHLGRVTHIRVSKLTIIDSDHGLSPGLRQAIIWTNAGILLIRTSGTNFSEISSEIHTFSFKKMYSKMLSAKWRSFCLGLNELRWSAV